MIGYNNVAGPAAASWQEEERTEYIPAAQTDEQYACPSPEQYNHHHQQQQQQQSPFSVASLDGQGFARPWSAAAAVQGDDTEPYRHSPGAGDELVCTAADAAQYEQELEYEEAPEQDTADDPYVQPEQPSSQEQYNQDDAGSEPEEDANTVEGDAGDKLLCEGSAAPADEADSAAIQDAASAVDESSAPAGYPTQQHSYQHPLYTAGSAAGDGDHAAEELPREQQHMYDLPGNAAAEDGDPQAAVEDDGEEGHAAAVDPAVATRADAGASSNEESLLHDAEQQQVEHTEHNVLSQQQQRQQQEQQAAYAEVHQLVFGQHPAAGESQMLPMQPQLPSQLQQQHQRSIDTACSLSAAAETCGDAAHGQWMELPCMQLLPAAAGVEAGRPDVLSAGSVSPAAATTADAAAGDAPDGVAPTTLAAAADDGDGDGDGELPHMEGAVHPGTAHTDAEVEGVAEGVAALSIGEDPQQQQQQQHGSMLAANAAAVEEQEVDDNMEAGSQQHEQQQQLLPPQQQGTGSEASAPAADEEVDNEVFAHPNEQQQPEQQQQQQQQQGIKPEALAAAGQEELGVDDDGFVYQDDGEGSSCCSTPPAPAAAAAAAAAVPHCVLPPAPLPAAETAGRVSGSSAMVAAVPAEVAAGSCTAAAAVQSAALGLRSLSLNRKISRSGGGSTGGGVYSGHQQQQQLHQQQQELWQPAESITGWQTKEEQGQPDSSEYAAEHTAGYGQHPGVIAAGAAAAAAKRRSSSGGISSAGIVAQQQQQQQQQQRSHQRSDRPVHSRNRPAGASSPLLDAAKAYRFGCQMPGSSCISSALVPSDTHSSASHHSAAASAYIPVHASGSGPSGRSLSAGRVMVAARLRPGSAPCRQSLSPPAAAAAKVSLLSSTGSSTSRAWVPGGATATQQQLLQVYCGQQQQQQQPGVASPRGSTSLRPVGIHLVGRVGSGGWGASAIAAAAAGGGSAMRPRTASPVRRPAWQQLSAGCSSTHTASAAAAGGADILRDGGVLHAAQQQQQQVVRPRPGSADAMRFKAYGSGMLQGVRPGSSSRCGNRSKRDLRVYSSSSNASNLPWQEQLQQLAEGDRNEADNEGGVECCCDGQLVAAWVGDSRQGQQQQPAWDDSPIPMNVPNSMPIADSTQGAGQQLAARASGRCASASHAYGFATGSRAAAAGRPRSAAAAAALQQQEPAWESATATAAAGGSSGTNVYLTETLQKLKQANSCCRKLGLALQYALAPCSKPRWQLQHIAVEVWQSCEQQQQQQQQQQGEAWQLKSSLTLGQFNRQLEKLLAKVAAAAAAAVPQAGAAAADGAAEYAGLNHKGSSNCSSLFSSPAGSRPGSPSRTRPGSASNHCARPGTAAHSSHQLSQPGGWCNPSGLAAIAIPEAVCRTTAG
jgi:hypothetical protein